MTFDEAIQAVSNGQSIKGIGTYGEKATHQVLKYYMQSDSTKHEIRVGRHIVDAIDDSGKLIEVQSKDFYRIKDKLRVLLENNVVEIVYPCPIKTCSLWVQPEDLKVIGEIKYRAYKNPCYILPELYSIKEFINFSNLKIRIVKFEEVEFKYLDGYGPNNKRHATKINRIPISFIGEEVLGSIEDYKRIIGIPNGIYFHSNQFARATKLKIDNARKALLFLTDIEVVNRVGRDSSGIIYEIAK